MITISTLALYIIVFFILGFIIGKSLKSNYYKTLEKCCSIETMAEILVKATSHDCTVCPLYEDCMHNDFVKPFNCTSKSEWVSWLKEEI